MRFMGSKARHAKHILPYILKGRRENQWYVEPFVGGGNMIDKVTGLRIGADINPFLIQALQLIRDDPKNLPKDVYEFSEYDYKELQKAKNGKLKGYAGFTFSFAGKWFGGWSRDKDNNDYVRRAFNNAQVQTIGLKGVLLKVSCYNELDIPKESIIYCDPPYAETTKYKDNFNHYAFWNWCENMTMKGHKVFVSEYSAPDNWITIWEKEVKVGVAKDKKEKLAIEKLFTMEEK